MAADLMVWAGVSGERNEIHADWAVAVDCRALEATCHRRRDSVPTPTVDP